MNKAVCLIDGFNLYHSLQDFGESLGFPYRKYKWLNLRKLIETIKQPLDSLKEMYYFTTICTWDSSKAKRHYRYIYALKNHDVKVRFGRFRTVERTCKATCREEYSTEEEKRTDVDIGVTLYSLAHQNVYDVAYLLTADSDQIPAVEKTIRYFPDKKIVAVVPPGAKAEELTGVCHQAIKIKEQHLSKSLFDLEIKSIGGKTISCPEEWRYTGMR